MEIDLETSEEKLSDRLGNCEVCGSTIAKYTCPKCEVKTCCLKCINIHKKELECSGIRDPTKFITLHNFTNIDLLNDYRMLEQMTRTVEGIGKKLPKEIIKNGRKILPKKMHKLKLALNDRKINILFLPNNFERHIKNMTYLHTQNKEVFWSIEWIFPNADNLKIFENKISENKKLAAALHKYVISGVDSFYSEKLQFYQSAGSANLSYYLKAENKCGEKYFELDGSESLKNNFEGKTIIEYPIIFVVLKEHSLTFSENCINIENYEEMDTNQEAKEMMQKKENSANKVLTDILKEDKVEKESKTKNLLFITDFSDGELSSDDNL